MHLRQVSLTRRQSTCLPSYPSHHWITYPNYHCVSLNWSFNFSGLCFQTHKATTDCTPLWKDSCLDLRHNEVNKYGSPDQFSLSLQLLCTKHPRLNSHLLTRLSLRLAYWNDSRTFTSTMQLQVNLAPETLPSVIISLPTIPEALHIAPETLSAAVSSPFPTQVQPDTGEKSAHWRCRPVWPWARHFTSEDPHFLFCKVRKLHSYHLPFWVTKKNKWDKAWGIALQMNNVLWEQIGTDSLQAPGWPSTWILSMDLSCTLPILWIFLSSSYYLQGVLQALE